MNRRIRKKKWKEETTARQADLLERMNALEELTRLMTAEQNEQREWLDMLESDLDLHERTDRARRNKEAAARLARERARRQREAERRRRMRSWAGVITFAAFAVAVFAFAIWLPV